MASPASLQVRDVGDRPRVGRHDVGGLDVELGAEIAEDVDREEDNKDGAEIAVEGKVELELTLVLDQLEIFKAPQNALAMCPPFSPPGSIGKASSLTTTGG